MSNYNSFGWWKKDWRDRKKKWCCCGGHSAKDVKKNKHHSGTLRRLLYQLSRRFKSKQENKRFAEFEKKFIENQIDSPVEYSKIIDDNFWDLT